MKHPERFTNAINKLVKAYMNGGLAKGDCEACAVGNMCDRNQDWRYVFCTYYGVQIISEIDYYGDAKRVIDKTGYSWQELARVESAFETNTEIMHNERHAYDEDQIQEDQYNGLMAVVDVLCDIEGFDKEVQKETKELFTV